MEKYIRVKANAEIDVIWVSEAHWLMDVYEAINSDCIQIVRTAPHHGGMVMIIDDEGKLKPDHHMNAIATVLYGRVPHDYIAGDVILAWQGERNGEPDYVPLPDGLYSWMLELTAELKNQLKEPIGKDLFK